VSQGSHDRIPDERWTRTLLRYAPWTRGPERARSSEGRASSRKRAARRPGATDNPGVNIYAAILAGGSGTRFWPASTRDVPKQMLPLAVASRF